MILQWNIWIRELFYLTVVSELHNSCLHAYQTSILPFVNSFQTACPLSVYIRAFLLPACIHSLYVLQFQNCVEEHFWDWGIDYRVVFWILRFVSKDYLYWCIDRSCILISCYSLNPIHSFWLLSARMIELFLRLVYAMFFIYLTLIWYMKHFLLYHHPISI